MKLDRRHLSEPAHPGKVPPGESQPEPQDASMPLAGPYARPELMNRDATPGAGALP